MNITVRRAALIAAAAATVARCAPAAVAATAAAPAWHIVKRVNYNGSNGVFTAVIAVGRTGGWAFDRATRCRPPGERSGSTWTQVPFPGQNNEMVIAAGHVGHQCLGVHPECGLSRALRWNGRTGR